MHRFLAFFIGLLALTTLSYFFMKQLLLLFLALLFSNPMQAQRVVITKPDFFTAPIRDGYPLFPDSLVYDAIAEEIRIPDVGMFPQLTGSANPRWRKVVFGNVDYLPGALMAQMPHLEEVVFEGVVGHFDCTLLLNCPKLRRIEFRGPVSSTGGPLIAAHCPQLHEIVFRSVVANPHITLSEKCKCPQLKGFSQHNAAPYDELMQSIPPLRAADLSRNPALLRDAERLAGWQCEVLTATRPEWMRLLTYQSASLLLPVLRELQSPVADVLEVSMQYAVRVADIGKNKLQVLRESPAYAPDPARTETFIYTPPTDSLLCAVNAEFNLDSIAGNGDDISRIKRLLYWVHDHIRHDGGNGFPEGPRSLSNIYHASRRNNCGYNCRAMAIALTEAYLAVGIPARYVTCLPRAWKSDFDCHVICVAWSESLNKWIWVDPTFAAYVTDEHGLLLHPGEVRHRLRHNLPLVLNRDANWNHQNFQTKEHYLDEYMAKNLYILQCNLHNQAHPEGPATHPQGGFVTLVPQGVDYPHTLVQTNDDGWFWQPPVFEQHEP